MLTSGTEAVYLDSSALVKLVVPERGSMELTRYLRGWPRRVSSALARVEVVRAARVRGPVAVARAGAMFGILDFIQLDIALLDAAAQLDPLSLRSLDAIHIATARRLGPELARLVTYDERMASSARALGLTVDAPGG